jgi:hypothetical protein
MKDSPNAVQSSYRISASDWDRMLEHHSFSVMISYFRRFPNESGVNQIMARDLPVQALQADQKGSVAEPWREDKLHEQHDIPASIW